MFLSISLLLTCCDHSDPEVKIINDRLHIITLQGEVALLKKGSQIKENGEVEIWGDDKIIVQKNFVAYTLYEDFVILCEEKDNGSQIFWSYEIGTEALQEYPTYEDFCESFPGDSLKWETLWVKDFAIIK